MREIKFRAWDNLTESIVSWENLKFDKDQHDDEICFYEQDSEYSYVGGADFEIMQYTGLKDKNGREIYENDITELEVDGDIRRFVAKIKTVVREVVSHPSFDDDVAKVAITGVVFEWNGFELFPCVDKDGEFDNSKMVVVGNIYENPDLLEVST